MTAPQLDIHPETAMARPSRGVLLAVLGAVVAAAVLGYWRTGMPDYEALARKAVAKEQAQAQSANGLPDATQMAAMVDKLSERLKSQPDDAQGWAMLGRVQMLLGRSEQAVVSYQRALALRADDARLLTDTAEALAMKNGRKLGGEPTQLLERALVVDPNLDKALVLSGAAAFERGDHAAAVRHWEQLLAVSPPDAEFVEQVRTRIDESRRLGKLPAGLSAARPLSAAASVALSATTASTASTATAVAKVEGIVYLAPALAAKVMPGDTVFIVARAVDGPRVPLAVLRKQVKDLPLNFTLDDSLAMAPQMKLSNFSKVIVSARISKSGQAMPVAGDLTGQTAAVAVGASGLRLEIAEVVGRP